MGTIKLVPQIMLFALVFTNIIATHQAWGEKECYGEKESIKHKCKENISIIDDYVRPGQECCHVVKESDMICVCRILSIEEESTISAVKLFYVARDCGNPVPVGKKCGSKCLIILTLDYYNTPNAKGASIRVHRCKRCKEESWGGE
ncbi:hypothetical protein EJB05_38656, partial [Eragrostis curvula]